MIAQIISERRGTCYENFAIGSFLDSLKVELAFLKTGCQQMFAKLAKLLYLTHHHHMSEARQWRVKSHRSVLKLKGCLRLVELSLFAMTRAT